MNKDYIVTIAMTSVVVTLIARWEAFPYPMLATVVSIAYLGTLMVGFDRVVAAIRGEAP